MVISNTLNSYENWFTPEAFHSRTQQKLPENGTFYESICKIMQEKGLDGKSNKKMIAATHLSGTICSHLKNDPEYHPSIKTIIAFCIGTYTSKEETLRLLRLKKYALSPEDPVHCAYMDLLRVYQVFGFGIRECNEFLKSWGFDKKHFLGSFDLDEEF